MSEIDPEYASGRKWFLPPEGILDGDNYAIARRYIERARADLVYFNEIAPMSDELRARHAALRPEIEADLDEKEVRLDAGETEIAAWLAHRMEREVGELNRGERTTITGDAHLMRERIRKVGHIYGVKRPDAQPPDDD